jgi:membrane protease YdiL (CAAX protease family)/uncharacterized RDD family membrane protein YckC
VSPAYATLRRRFLAAFLDTAFWLIAAPLLFGFLPPSASEPVIALYGLAVFTTWFNYFAFCEWRWGQTIGKNAAGIEVRTDDGERPGWSTAALRNLMRIVDVPFTLTGIGAVLWLRSPRRKRLGDRVAHTVVVRRIPGTARDASTVLPAAAAAAAARGPEPVGVAPGLWTSAHVVWGIAALIGLSVVEILLVAPFDPDLSSLAAKLAAQAMLVVTLVGIAFVFVRHSGRRLAAAEALGLRRFKLSDLKWVAAGMAAYMAFALVYGLFVSPEQEDVARDLGFGSSLVGGIAAGVLIVGAAPVAEEIFFRGFVFGGFRHRLPLWPAALLAGAIFGIFHFTGVSSIGVVPQLAAFGVVLCWLYDKTGSIWPTILLHAVNNLIAFIFLATG